MKGPDNVTSHFRREHAAGKRAQSRQSADFLADITKRSENQPQTHLALARSFPSFRRLAAKASAESWHGRCLDGNRRLGWWSWLEKKNSI